MIKVNQLTRSYGDFTAVDDVSFEVGRGQIVGLLGPNGAGKTTLMKILTGYHFPSKGEAWIKGVNIQDNPQAAQAFVGYLPESSPVYPDLTVLEYMEFMAGVRGLDPKTSPDAIERALQRTDAAQFRHKVTSHLSKGQKQRVGLAQAILTDPEILILDEPTSGLDPNQILEFRQLIQNIGKEKTVILSTHIMQEVEAICQRVLIMNQGKIVAEGTTEDIAKSFQGESRYKMTLKGIDGKSALEKLKGLRGMNGAVTLLHDVGEPTVECSFSKDAEGGEVLFDWAVANKVKIVSLIPQTLSLEDLFVQLTKEAASGETA